MSEPDSLSDEQFLAAFLDCTIPPAGFNHSGHLRVAWILLQRYPLAEAVSATCEGVARLAAHLGATEKYHRTLTEALVRLMAHGGAAHLSWEAFLGNNDLLVRDARGLLARYYSDEQLLTPEAQLHFVPPDRLPLPV